MYAITVIVFLMFVIHMTVADVSTSSSLNIETDEGIRELASLCADVSISSSRNIETNEGICKLASLCHKYEAERLEKWIAYDNALHNEDTMDDYEYIETARAFMNWLLCSFKTYDQWSHL